MIFQRQREAYIAPYEQLLQQETQASIIAKKQLNEADKQWKAESNIWFALANKVDHLQDNLAAIIEANHALRLQTQSVYVAVMHDHSYARTQQ